MPRTPRVSYRESLDALIARDPADLTDRDLLEHLDALRMECARIFAIRQAKAERGEIIVKEADAVAALSDRFCDLYTVAERRLGVGTRVPHLDLMKPDDRARALRHPHNEDDRS